MYGINLGGWLVLERFLNPSILLSLNDSRVRDEWTYLQYYKQDPEKLQRLKNHYETWVSKADIEKLAHIGFTHVRIPVGVMPLVIRELNHLTGYWAVMSEEELALKGEPFITGQWPYVQRVLGWLKQHGMKAIIDLHAAPGSQNGWDNSGRTMDNPEWGQGEQLHSVFHHI